MGLYLIDVMFYCILKGLIILGINVIDVLSMRIVKRQKIFVSCVDDLYFVWSCV